MKVTKKIKRGLIIKAMRTEPLEAGAWFHSCSLVDREQIQTCPVCAVGAVLRTASFTKSKLPVQTFTLGDPISQQICEGWYTGDLRTMLKNGNYMAALSQYFEDNARHIVTKRFREKLVKFVKKNFPREITITMEG